MTYRLHVGVMGLVACLGLAAPAHAQPTGSPIDPRGTPTGREADKQVLLITYRFDRVSSPDGVEMRAGIEFTWRMRVIDVPELCLTPVYPNPTLDPAAVKCLPGGKDVLPSFSEQHPPPGTYRAGDALALVPGLGPDLTLAGQALDVRYDGGPPLMAIDARDVMERLRTW